MCGLLALARSTYRYRKKGSESDVLDRLRALAERWPRYGYRRLHLELRREGKVVNHKRVYRLYWLQGLALRRRRRKRAAGLRVLPLAVPRRRNQRWSMDFLSDALASGRRFRVLMVLDDGIRTALALAVDTSLPGAPVVRVLAESVAALLAYGTALILDRDRGLTRRLGQCGWCGRFRLDFEGRPRIYCSNAHRLAYDGKMAAERMRAYRQRQRKKRGGKGRGSNTADAARARVRRFRAAREG